jgi:hypothetical protein
VTVEYSQVVYVVCCNCIHILCHFLSADYCSVRAVQGTGLGHVDTAIVVSSLAQGMDDWTRLPVLCCPVEIEALRRADPPCMESYKIWDWFIISESNYEVDQVTRPNPYSCCC